MPTAAARRHWRTVRDGALAAACFECQCQGWCGQQHGGVPEARCIRSVDDATLDVVARAGVWVAVCRGCRTRIDAPLRGRRAAYTRAERRRQLSLLPEPPKPAKRRRKKERAT